MTREEAYNILYNEDGTCHHSPEILQVLTNLIKISHGIDRIDRWSIDRIDRWNIYQPYTLHIVYVVDFGFGWNKNDVIWSSKELLCPISDFAGELKRFRRNNLLNEILE